MKYKGFAPMIANKLSEKLVLAGAKLTAFGESMSTLDLLSPDDKKIISRNSRFKGLHKNKRAFVIANGPSISTQPLELLEGELTFAVSGFYKHPIVEKWQPTYYSFIDPAFFQDETIYSPFFSELTKRVTDCTFFLPLARGYHFQQKNQLLDKEKTFFVATHGQLQNRKLDLTDMNVGFNTVAAFSIALALYMGCSPIYLIGFDHDLLSHQGKDRHFYNGQIVGGKRGEMFRDKSLLDIWGGYYGVMKLMMRWWDNYFYLNDLAEKSGQEIINATNSGFLDVFPRAKFEELFTK